MSYAQRYNPNTYRRHTLNAVDPSSEKPTFLARNIKNNQPILLQDYNESQIPTSLPTTAKNSSPSAFFASPKQSKFNINLTEPTPIAKTPSYDPKGNYFLSARHHSPTTMPPNQFSYPIPTPFDIRDQTHMRTGSLSFRSPSIQEMDAKRHEATEILSQGRMQDLSYQMATSASFDQNNSIYRDSLETNFQKDSSRKSQETAFTTAMKALQAKVWRLEEKLRQSEALNNQIADQLLNESAQCSKLQEDFETLLSREKELVTAFEQENKALKQRAELLEKEKQFCESTMANVISEKKILSEENSQLHSQLTEQTKLVTELLAREKKLQELSENSSKEVKLKEETAKTQVEQLQAKVKSLEAELIESKKVYKEHLSELVLKKDSQAREIEALKAEYSQQMRDFQKELEFIETSDRARIKELSEQNEVLESRVDELEKSLESRTKENQALRLNLEKYFDQLQQANRKLIEIQAESPKNISKFPPSSAAIKDRSASISLNKQVGGPMGTNSGNNDFVSPYFKEETNDSPDVMALSRPTHSPSLHTSPDSPSSIVSPRRVNSVEISKNEFMNNLRRLTMPTSPNNFNVASEPTFRSNYYHSIDPSIYLTTEDSKTPQSMDVPQLNRLLSNESRKNESPRAMTDPPVFEYERMTSNVDKDFKINLVQVGDSFSRVSSITPSARVSNPKVSFSKFRINTEGSDSPKDLYEKLNPPIEELKREIQEKEKEYKLLMAKTQVIIYRFAEKNDVMLIFY